MSTFVGHLGLGAGMIVFMSDSCGESDWTGDEEELIGAIVACFGEKAKFSNTAASAGATVKSFPIFRDEEGSRRSWHTLDACPTEWGFCTSTHSS